MLPNRSAEELIQPVSNVRVVRRLSTHSSFVCSPVVVIPGTAVGRDLSRQPLSMVLNNDDENGLTGNDWPSDWILHAPYPSREC